jgi:hypothetical protein
MQRFGNRLGKSRLGHENVSVCSSDSQCNALPVVILIPSFIRILNPLLCLTSWASKFLNIGEYPKKRGTLRLPVLRVPSKSDSTSITVPRECPAREGTFTV